MLGIILLLMAGVGFLTFGFTQAVCGTPPTRFLTGSVGNGSVIIHGYSYDLSKFDHPAAGSTFDGNTNPLFEGGWNAAGGDISFLFQNVGGPCHGIITAANNSSITTSGDDPEWYFPCNIFNQFGTTGVNLTGYGSSTNCHVSSTARSDLSELHAAGQVYYTWGNISNTNRNLAVFES